MPALPFTLDQLRILKAIAAQGSFKKAADLLYVTQPAVSLQIQNCFKIYFFNNKYFFLDDNF